MKKCKKVGRLLGLVLSGGTLLQLGSCLNWDNIGFGFNAGLGAIPANLVGNYITANFLGFLTPEDTAE